MKKIKLLLTGIAILAIVSASLAANNKFGAGSIWCFPSAQTVDPDEPCNVQPNGVQVNFILGTTIPENPCPSGQTPYLGSTSSCVNVSGSFFDSVLP